MIIILLFAFLHLADLSYQPKKYVVKRNLLALRKSQWLKDLHDEIFILRSKWTRAAATKNEDLIQLLQNVHVIYTPKMSVTMIMQFYVIHGSTLNVNLNYIDYKYLQGCSEPWYCLSCTPMLFYLVIWTIKIFY